MSENLGTKARTASTRSFSAVVAKSPSDPDLGPETTGSSKPASHSKMRSKTLRGSKSPSDIIVEPKSSKIPAIFENNNKSASTSSEEIPRVNQPQSPNPIDTTSSSTPTTNKRASSALRGPPRGLDSTPTTNGVPSDFHDSELVAAFEAVLLMPSRGGVLQDMSKEDWYSLMSKETVRVTNKLSGKSKARKTAKGAFDSDSPTGSGANLFASPTPLVSEQVDPSVPSGEDPEASLTALYDEAAKNWQNLDLAKKERRIRSFMAKYEHIRAQLDEHVMEALPTPLVMSDLPTLPTGQHYLIDPKDDFTLVEMGDDSTSYEKQLALLHVEQKNIEVNYYIDWFSNDEHRNWIGEDKEQGAVVVSIQLQRKDKNGTVNANSRIFIRTKDQDEWMFLPSRPKSGEILAALKKEKPWLAKIKLEKVKTEKICAQLVQLESTLSFKQTIKVGVLPVKVGQANENQMFSNREVSPAYEEFLDFLGNQITLQGWNGYTGGLDVNQNTTGTHSRYREFEEYKIMYHVSTLLPFYPADEQQVERKRHLGNDVVCIIWLDGDAHSFNPHCLTTNFTFIFVVVSLDKAMTTSTGHTHYRVAVASKEGTRPFGPRLPHPAVFKKDSTFLNFLLTKIVNSERAAFEAPAFKQKMRRTRATFLDELVQAFK